MQSSMRSLAFVVLVATSLGGGGLALAQQIQIS